MELRHSGSIARRDLSEVSDDELLSIIYAVGSEFGMAPIKAVEPTASACLPVPNSTGVLRLVPQA